MEQRYFDVTDKIRAWAGRVAGYIIIALVCVSYILTAFIKIDESGKTVWEIIGSGVIVFLLGFFINRLFDLQGISNAERDGRFQATVELHAETVMKICPMIDKLDPWCATKNAENLRAQRMRVLASEGLKYSDYFDDDGSAKGIEINEARLRNRYTRRLEKRRIACYKKALYLHLTPLSAGELTSESCKVQDPFNLGRSKDEYEKQTSIEDIISKVGIALIIGYYGVELLQSFSYATLIWNVLQIALFLIAGFVKMMNSEMFIMGEYRGRIVKKINYLEMFYSSEQRAEGRERSESANGEHNV